MGTSPQMQSSFGARLRWWRTRRGQSQLDLAGEAGTSQRHVSFLESSRTQPSREMARHGVTTAYRLSNEHYEDVPPS